MLTALREVSWYSATAFYLKTDHGYEPTLVGRLVGGDVVLSGRTVVDSLLIAILLLHLAGVRKKAMFRLISAFRTRRLVVGWLLPTAIAMAFLLWFFDGSPIVLVIVFGVWQLTLVKSQKLCRRRRLEPLLAAIAFLCIGEALLFAGYAIANALVVVYGEPVALLGDLPLGLFVIATMLVQVCGLLILVAGLLDLRRVPKENERSTSQVPASAHVASVSGDSTPMV